MDIELASFVLYFRRVLFTIKLLHKCFHFWCPLLMPYWTSLSVLRRTYGQSSLYETLFHCNTLSKHHHHHHQTSHDDYLYIFQFYVPLLMPICLYYIDVYVYILVCIYTCMLKKFVYYIRWLAYLINKWGHILNK
jgi:hypothetical protein